jgi:hypothetical protein
VRAVLESAGVQDILTKSWGARIRKTSCVRRSPVEDPAQRRSGGQAPGQGSARPRHGGRVMTAKKAARRRARRRSRSARCAAASASTRPESDLARARVWSRSGASASIPDNPRSGAWLAKISHLVVVEKD